MKNSGYAANRKEHRRKVRASKGKKPRLRVHPKSDLMIAFAQAFGINVQKEDK